MPTGAALGCCSAMAAHHVGSTNMMKCTIYCWQQVNKTLEIHQGCDTTHNKVTSLQTSNIDSFFAFEGAANLLLLLM